VTGCNLGAAHRAGKKALFIAFVLINSAAAHGQNVRDAALFVAGGALGLGAHEGGHLMFDGIFGASAGLRKVSFGSIPFFAITHEPVPPAREFAISSAGFWMQHAGSELILSRRPHLRHEHAPLLKGVLAFNVLASVAYSGAAFATTGPDERDTRGMALSARVDEPWVGVLILAPAALDAARYYQPDAAWLRWASRAVKVGGAVAIVRAVR
jgi:hypothetical protein